MESEVHSFFPIKEQCLCFTAALHTQHSKGVAEVITYVLWPELSSIVVWLISASSRGLRTLSHKHTHTFFFMAELY